MNSRGRYLLGILFVTGAIALAYGAFTAQSASSDTADIVLRELAKTNQRLDDIEKSLAEFSEARRLTAAVPRKESDPASTDRGALSDSIARRFELIEGELLALWGVAGPGLKPEPVEDNPASFDDLLDSPAPPAPSTVSMRFDDDGKKTAWSAATKSAIDQAFNTGSFYTVQDGDLQTDCRRSICKLEWFMPSLNGLSSEDLDMMVSLARLELVGLAGKSAQLIGRMDTQLHLDNDRPSIAVFIERKDIETRQYQ